MILQTTLLQYTRPIFEAGERVGRALEGWRRRHFWQNPEPYCHEVKLAYEEYNRAFDRLYDFIEEQRRWPAGWKSPTP